MGLGLSRSLERSFASTNPIESFKSGSATSPAK